jgi:uncharacterized membrane protein
MSTEKGSRSMIVRRRAQRGERGAILVLSAAGMVIALIASALAIDIGRLAQSAREDQKLADMAALDAVRGLPADYQSLAEASALRNGFPLGTAGYSIRAAEGVKVNGTTCQDVAGAGSACVTVTSPHSNNFPFVNGRNSMTRAGVAARTAFGGFSIGSSLVTIDTNRSNVLNRVLGGMLKGSAFSLSALSWQGLAAGDVTLEALRTQLATMGYSVGTVDELLATNLTMNRLLTATAGALNTEGGAANVAVATQLLSMAATVTNTTQFTLGRFMHVDSGANNTALGSQLNVFQLLTGSAQVANGNNFVDIPDIGLTVGNVTSTRVKLKVIEPVQFYFGPVGGSVSTSQLDLTVTPTLDLPISVLGLVGTRVKNDLPVRIVGAGATGTLTAASCAALPGITVTVDPTAFSGSATASLDVYATVLFTETRVLTIPTTNVTSLTDGAPTNLTFNYPSEFPPPLGTRTSKHAGSNPIGLNGIVSVSADPVQNNTIGALASTVVSTTLTALNTVLGNLDTNVMTPLLQALGTDVGSADVTALSLQCDTPTLTG